MQFSGLFVVALLFTSSSAAIDNPDKQVPDDFNGVWKIKSALNDGKNQPLAKDPDGSLSVGECGMMEIIITANRIVIVNTDGEATVGQFKILAQKPELKIKWTGFGYHAKQDGPIYAILKQTDKNEIQFSFSSEEQKRVDASIGGKQFVLTAIR